MKKFHRRYALKSITNLIFNGVEDVKKSIKLLRQSCTHLQISTLRGLWRASELSSGQLVLSQEKIAIQ